MLFIYAKGKESVIFISILAYLKVQVVSTYNVYQEKMLTEKFLKDLNPTFFFLSIAFL